MNKLDCFKLANVFFIEVLLTLILLLCYLLSQNHWVIILILSSAILELLHLKLSLHTIEVFELTNKFDLRFNKAASILSITSGVMVTVTVIVTAIIIY